MGVGWWGRAVDDLVEGGAARFTRWVSDDEKPDAGQEATVGEVTAARLEHERVGLDVGDLDPDPISQLRAWWDEAAATGLHQPETIALATADADGRPSVRFVLLRGLDERGLVFFTNYESRKGRELAANPFAAVTVPWHPLGRQARVNGSCERVSAAESDAYFASRGRGSQLSAWASPQSRVVADRHELDDLRAVQEARFEGSPVERPTFWGGFRIVPDEVEFWQGRADRFHDRFRYRPVAAGGWRIERLGP